MRFTKKHAIYLLIIASFLITLLLPLPYYIYKPGTADPLTPVVQVQDGFQSEGDLHLVTVRGGRATPLQLLIAGFSDYQDIMPLEDVFPEGYDREAYLQAQFQLMENSQEAATVVAYQAAGEAIDIRYEGVYVLNVIEGMPAEGILEIGDQILQVNGEEISDTNHLIETVNSFNAGDKVIFLIERLEEQFEQEIELVAFPNNPDQVGVGVQLVTNREVEVERSVEFASGNIGGPSAGLVLALEIYDQLTGEDITNGREIAGTGEIDYDGSVHRIGGVDKKVIAADREDCKVFFAPYEGGSKTSNYELAKATAEAIGTDMVIVPVNTFEDALAYLRDGTLIE
ncbi:PDZ domain-containing protein [Amphibacillus marinus]|uniref:endopeptidase La n=1 Tax=Amphibacillus marinus TaxID=872970 RepID=A0A1H8I6H3_9BACI|nr:SepM family pheromone-processing serine protease [Amphibacillus marinus]SEN64039.1 PDZ domain-containing protein [Amphibacillus marinus]